MLDFRFSLAAALALAGCGAAPESSVMPADEAERFVTAALAPCDVATGRMGAGLSALDGSGDPVEVVRASREVERVCHEASAEIDAARERLAPEVLAACRGVGLDAELVAVSVQKAMATPSNPVQLANLEDVVGVYHLTKTLCDRVLTGANPG